MSETALDYLRKNGLSITKIGDAYFHSSKHNGKKFVLDWVAERALELAKQEASVFELEKQIKDLEDGETGCPICNFALQKAKRRLKKLKVGRVKK